MFEQNKQQQLPDKTLYEQLCKEFPDSKCTHNISINGLRGHYNSGSLVDFADVFA